MHPFAHFLKERSSFSFLQKLFITFLLALFSLPTLTNGQSSEEYLAFEVLPPSLFNIPGSRYNHYPSEIIDFNGKAAFIQSTHPAFLWVSDGSLKGTDKISFPEWDKIMLENPRNRSVVAGDKLFFTVEINKKNHIWATDGTQEGTYEVVSPETAGYHTLRTVKAFGNRIIFVAYVDANEPESVFLINENGVGAQKNNDLSTVSGSTANIGNDLYAVESVGKDRYLVKIDQQGNANQVWQMPAVDSESTRSISQLTEAIDKIYFVGNDGNGPALWVFDGTTAIRLFNPSKDAKKHRAVRSLTVVGDKAYFFSNYWDEDLKNGNGDFSFGNRLYVSDGTVEGTNQVWDTNLLDSGVDNHNANNNPIAAAGDRILFVARYK